MEETKKVNKKKLIKGVQIMLICLLLMFIGPALVHIAFSNQEKPLYIPLLILGVTLCIAAIFALFKGINTITDSLFDRE